MRKMRVNLCLLLVSCGGGLALCEGALRLFYPKYTPLVETHVSRDAERIWGPSPNSRRQARHPDTGAYHSLHHNNLGLRQHRDFSEAALAAATNIGVFGDSFVENVRMAAPYSFTEPLDYLLNQGKKRFNVLNFGVDGYGPGQSFLYYRVFPHAKDLDYVFFTYSQNDLRNIYETGLFRLDDTGQLVRNEATRPSWWTPLISRLHLSYLILDVSGKVLVSQRLLREWKGRYQDARARGIHSATSGDSLGNEYLKESLDIFRKLIDRWKRLVEKNGGQFFVVLLPYPRPSPLVTTMLEEEQVPVVNLYECFRSLTPADTDGPWFHLYKFRNDGHWNEAGNHAAVICLYRFLEEKLRLSPLPEDEFQKILSDYYTAFHAWLPMNVGGGGSLSPRTAARIRAKYAMTDASLYKKRMKELDEAKENLRAAMAGRHIIASDFDVYLNGRRLGYVKEGCRPADLQRPFFSHVIPVDENDLPAHRVRHGYVRLTKSSSNMISMIDRNICIATKLLPRWPIRYLRTGQFDRAEGVRWEGELAIGPDPDGTGRRQLVPVAGRHIIASDFDVYLDGRRLVFVKKECRLPDREASFFVHVIPVDARDLPPDRVPYGFDSLDFNGCTIERRLPSYPIRHIRTGQFTKNAWGDYSTLWESKFSINPDSNRKRRPELVLATGEEIIDHPDLDVSLDGKRLVYVDKDCRPAGREGKFFLHVTPVDPKDLLNAAFSGFDNFDFFPRSSFRIDEFGCRIRKRLPAYPIRHIHTGQFVQDAQGNKRYLWEDEFSMNQGGGGD